MARRLMLALFSALFVLYVAGPVLWLLSSSLQMESEITAVPPNWLPPHPGLHNFTAIFSAGDSAEYVNRGIAGFLQRFFHVTLPALYNSLAVGLWVAALNLVFSLTSAYAIAVISFRGRRATLYTVLATRVIPDIALVVPLFLVIRNLGLINSIGALVVTYLAVTVPFTIFILISYFEGIPRDLYRASRIDGCGHWGALRHVYLPLSLPALVAALMFAFLTSWNEFLFALVLTQSAAAQTLPIIIAGFVMDFTTSFSFVNAAGVIAILPPVLLAFLFQRYIVSGLTAGAVKG